MGLHGGGRGFCILGIYLWRVASLLTTRGRERDEFSVEASRLRGRSNVRCGRCSEVADGDAGRSWPRIPEDAVFADGFSPASSTIWGNDRATAASNRPSVCFFNSATRCSSFCRASCSFLNANSCCSASLFSRS